VQQHDQRAIGGTRLDGVEDDLAHVEEAGGDEVVEDGDRRSSLSVPVEAGSRVT
jgi:hypothetical protein